MGNTQSNAQSQLDAAIIEIYEAAGSGQMRVIESVLKRNGNVGFMIVNEKSQDGRRPLHAAALGGHTRVMELLVAFGAYPPLTDDNGESPLHVAASTGRVDAVEKLIELRADVHQTALHGKATALHYAARYGHVGVIEALVRAGGRVKDKNKDGYRPLHSAAFGGHAGAIEKLVGLGADVHQADEHGATALHIAARYGFVDCIETLLNLRANINRKDKGGFTALDYATIVRQQVSLNHDAIRLLRDKMSDGFPVTTSDINQIGFREKVCIGRALAVAYAPHSLTALNKTERPSLRTMYYPTSVADFLNSVSIFVTSPTPRVVTLISPPDSLAIPKHATFIVLYHHHHTSTSYIWYINPWGFGGDDSWYRTHSKMHPIEAINIHLENFFNSNDIIVINQHASMTKVGPQEKSTGFGSGVGVCERIGLDGKGTCLTWGEMYLDDVSQWLKTVEGESLSPEEFETRLSKVFGRNIDHTNAFESVSLFAFHRWANKEIVPQSLLYAIYTAIDIRDPEKLKQDVMKAQDMYESRKSEYAIDQLPQADISRKFLVDSSLYSPDVKSALKQDIGRIEHFLRLETERDRVSDYIVRSTLILVDCKTQAVLWRNPLRRYKRDFSTMQQE